jgi:dTDP-4-dehydrorhamnose reductase
MNALIGYTGFVGSNLLKNIKGKRKLDLYNSKNINQIKNQKYNQVICAGLSATKWIANKYPNKDIKNINILINNLKNIKCDLFILISTIDVHNSNEVYGKNRKIFEDFIKKKFNFLIIRLPALFGKGLKKNIIYDLLNKNNLDKISIDDYFQWFDLESLYKIITNLIENNPKNEIVELYSRPIKNKLIVKFFPNIKLKKQSRKKIIYNYKPKQGFYKSQKYILNKLRIFIKQYEK